MPKILLMSYNNHLNNCDPCPYHILYISFYSWNFCSNFFGFKNIIMHSHLFIVIYFYVYVYSNTLDDLIHYTLI